MKGNKGAYILLPIVAIVWGLIIYRIVKYVQPGEMKIKEPQRESIMVKPETLEPDTFTIQANYRDPFLGNIRVEKKAPVASAPKPVTPKPAPKPPADFPKVTFHGLVKNNDSKKSFALISVNGKMKTVTEKDEINGLKILTIYRDSVTTSFNKQVMTIRKK